MDSAFNSRPQLSSAACSARQASSELARIFIGGTGRSGTSVFYRALGCHRDIFALPQEMRFLIDPDGLKDLVDALTVRYSPTNAREALYRFERLMRIYLTTPERPPYRGFDLANWLGDDLYWQCLDQFCTALVEVEFPGVAWQVQPENEGRAVALAKKLQLFWHRLWGRPAVPYRITLPREHLKVAKYFQQRGELITLAAAFVDELFLAAAQREDKQTWCEKTPHSIYYLDFLWELFPKSVFIHIKRDPRGVIHSMTKDSWKRAPGTVQEACIFLRQMYERWFDVSQAVQVSGAANRRYLELKIEDVAASPRDALEQVAAFCSLAPDFTNIPEISPQRLNEWQNSMDHQDLQQVNEHLAEDIVGMGYAL